MKIKKVLVCIHRECSFAQLIFVLISKSNSILFAQGQAIAEANNYLIKWYSAQINSLQYFA